MAASEDATVSVTPRSKHVLFTGVGGCIGEAVLTCLRNDGWTITALSHIDAECGPIVVDFSDDEGIAAAIATIPHQLDAVILAHGLLEPGPWHAVSPKSWRHMLDINVNSHYAILHATLPKVSHGGSVVVVSSTAAFDHSPVGGPHYTASKWALNGLVRHLADDLGAQNVRINSICPGLVESPMGRAFLTEQEYLAAAEEIPLRRAASPDEIAQTAMFLVSDAASYVTGALIPVSGGYR